MSQRAPIAKRCSLKIQRQRLEQHITLERRQLANAAQEWHSATAGFDQKMVKLAVWRKPLLAVGGLLLTRQLRRSPSRVLQLGKRAVTLYAVTRNVRGIINRLRSL